MVRTDKNYMAELLKIKAKIELFEGVRQTPVVSGYRPAFNFHGAPTKISGRIDLINMNVFAPGETAIVQVTFIKHMLDDDYFTVGQVFTFDEGPHVVGKGQIIERVK
jgi:translation elongation factor EF-Tu-like GTPase